MLKVQMVLKEDKVIEDQQVQHQMLQVHKEDKVILVQHQTWLVHKVQMVM